MGGPPSNPEVGREVLVMARRSGVAEALVERDRSGHQTGGVEREDRRTMPASQPFAGGEQGLGDTEPPSLRVYGEGSAAGPAARPSQTAGRDVGVERARSKHHTLDLGDRR